MIYIAHRHRKTSNALNTNSNTDLVAISTRNNALRIWQKTDVGEPLGNSQIQPIMSHLQPLNTRTFYHHSKWESFQISATSKNYL